MALALNADQYKRSFRIDTTKLAPLCQLIAELTGIAIPKMKPIGGTNVFATEAGIHQGGLLKNPDTYLPFRPETVGADGIQLVLGRPSGGKAVAHRLQQLDLPHSDADVAMVVERIKSQPKGVVIDDALLVELLKGGRND